MDIVKAVAALDAAPGLHLARILLLLNAFSKEDDEGSIEGLTKLAKLDFLLRYPVMLDRARERFSWKITSGRAWNPRWFDTDLGLGTIVTANS